VARTTLIVAFHSRIRLRAGKIQDIYCKEKGYLLLSNLLTGDSDNRQRRVGLRTIAQIAQARSREKTPAHATDAPAERAAEARLFALP
jgi:hypothetical protein